MPNDRPGDRIRNDFHDAAKTEVSRRGLAIGLGVWHGAPWHNYNQHPFRNIKENTLTRFVLATTPEPADLFSSGVRCTQGCVWLYVLARDTSAPWGVDWKRIRELDLNFETNLEEGFLVLLDQSPHYGFIVPRTRLSSVIPSPMGESDQVLVKEKDLVREVQFDKLEGLFEFATGRPPLAIAPHAIPPPPLERCRKHGLNWARRGQEWVCPLCEREKLVVGESR
jgi:hypothetical protein